MFHLGADADGDTARLGTLALSRPLLDRLGVVAVHASLSPTAAPSPSPTSAPSTPTATHRDRTSADKLFGAFEWSSVVLQAAGDDIVVRPVALKPPARSILDRLGLESPRSCLATRFAALKPTG